MLTALTRQICHSVFAFITFGKSAPVGSSVPLSITLILIQYTGRGILIDLAPDGIPHGPNDLLIATTTVANDLTLVTTNSKAFGRVAGLST